MRYLIILALIFSAFSGVSQNKISGVVLDSLTREPVPFANVFFANTTIGTVTNAEGKFLLENFPSGKYDLTISFVGYNTWQQPLLLENSKYEITALLPQQVIKLSEILVKADTTGWRQNYELFRKNIIGQTRNAMRTNIEKPRNIHLYFDPADRVLVAYAREEISIINNSLGYKLNYKLVDFELDFKANKLVYYGVPRFEILQPKNKPVQKRWDRERVKTYNGSFAHFVNSLYTNSLALNKFIVHELYRIPNRERPPENFLNERIKYWMKKYRDDTGKVIIQSNGTDSLNYYMKLKRLPVTIDSIGKQISDVNSIRINGDPAKIKYSGMMRVIYTGESEEEGFARMQFRAPQNLQMSIVHFLGESLTLYENGYYEDIRTIFMEGYWAWSEKLADLLPLEYKPVNSK